MISHCLSFRFTTFGYQDYNLHNVNDIYNCGNLIKAVGY